MTLTKPYEASFYLGDNDTKTFSFLFDEVSENFIKVMVKHIDGSIYTPIFSIDMELKQVVFGEDEIAPTTDDVICIYRETPAIQDTQFNTLQGYNAKALENILSKIVAMIQEMKANGFSTQILQGEPWALDLLKPADDGASVQIDYQARVLKKGLYFKMSDGNLQASADGQTFIQMPKSANILEIRQVIEETPYRVVFQYRVGETWYSMDFGAVEKTAEDAKEKSEQAVSIANQAVASAEIANEIAASAKEVAENISNKVDQAVSKATDALTAVNALDESKADKTALAQEITDRVNADNDLQTQIDAMAAASDVADVVGTYADLQAYDTSKLTDNAIIKVLNDETQDGASTYYRWTIGA